MNHKVGCSFSQLPDSTGWVTARLSTCTFIYPFMSGLHGGAVLTELKLNEHLMMCPFQWPIHSPTRPPPHSWIFKCISWALSGWGVHAWDGHIWRSLEISDPHAHTGQGSQPSTCECVSPIRRLAEGEELHAWLRTISSSFMTLPGGTQRAARGNRDASQHKVRFLPLGTGRVGVNQVKFRCIQFFGGGFLSTLYIE